LLPRHAAFSAPFRFFLPAPPAAMIGFDADMPRLLPAFISIALPAHAMLASLSCRRATAR